MSSHLFIAIIAFFMSVSHYKKMNGPKKWVSSKVHRRTSSKSNLNSNHSPPSPLDDSSNNRPLRSPPIQLPPEDATAATAIVDFGSGSSLLSQKSSDVAAGSYSSTDTTSTGLTPSPSTTPPKKTWEKNYKSFLKRNVSKHSRVPASASASGSHAPNQHGLGPKMSASATNLLPRVNQHPPLFESQKNEDFAPSLADGFGDHSLRSTSATNYFARRESLTAPSSPVKPKESRSGTSASNHFAMAGRRESYTAPSSPSKPKESRGGALFKRIRSKTKSADGLDSSMKRGVNRRSPMNTPPGSASSTPIQRRSPPTPPTSAPSAPTVTLQDGLEKAAELSELLFPPTLTSHASLGSTQQNHRAASTGDVGDGSLDQARRRGHAVSIATSTTTSQTPTPTSTSPTIPTLLSRVQSMGSKLVIPEGEPVVDHNKEESIERERRKAFTDFHYNGMDSGSAYLGDDSSLHKNSLFLTSMAYPAGSAGGKVHTRHTFSQSGAHSMERDRVNSTSLNAISETNPQSKESEAEISPGRALKRLLGPEHWKKGERHAILPGVLCMCPIQVLNNMMARDEEASSESSQTPLHSRRGSGIGSMLVEEDGADPDGWFFADHHQPSAAGGTLPHHGGDAPPPAAFGGKTVLGKATVASLGMRSFLNEVYGWCTGVFVLRQNYLFEYREGDSLNGLPSGYAQLPLAEAYPHNHFTNALHLDYFEKPCCKSGKRSLLLRVENKCERDRWVSMLQAAARLTMHDLYDVDESDGAPEFGRGRYAVVRPAKRKDWRKAMSFSDARYMHATNSQSSFRNVSSHESLGGYNKTSNIDLETDVEYDCALKIIDKKEFWSSVRKGRERVDTLVREAAVQTTLAVKGGDTPGFLRLRNIFETGEHLVLELELLEGTDLFQHVSSRGVLGEVEAARITRDLLSCLDVLDRVGIAHRDVKPANLLMCRDGDADGARVKLADYGMASFVGVDNLVRGRCGTPGFVAPEILLTGVNGGYGNRVDVFSAGVTLYVMLAGYEPFYGESDAELIKANREARVDFPHADWHSVSIEGRDLIERMLVVDPAKRIGPSEALRHPWITRRATPSRNNDCT